MKYDFGAAYDELADHIYEHNVNVGWWDPTWPGGTQRPDGTSLMLIVSEISEAMEGNRKSLMDDKLPHRPMEEVELADAIIRIMDYGKHKGYDVSGAILEKQAYNEVRADHKRENRAQPGGKAY